MEERQEKRVATKDSKLVWDAVKEGDLRRVKQHLRKYGQNLQHINEPLPDCSYGETLLHYAAYHGHVNVVALLIRAGIVVVLCVVE